MVIIHSNYITLWKNQKIWRMKNCIYLFACIYNYNRWCNYHHIGRCYIYRWCWRSMNLDVGFRVVVQHRSWRTQSCWRYRRGPRRQPDNLPRNWISLAIFTENYDKRLEGILLKAQTVHQLLTVDRKARVPYVQASSRAFHRRSSWASRPISISVDTCISRIIASGAPKIRLWIKSN